MPLFKKAGGLNVFSSFKGTEQSQRLQNTFGEVQTFKRELIKAELAIKAYEKATQEVLKVTDDSMAAFPRVWRKDENTATSPSHAVLPDEDLAKPAPTTKKLASYPSQKATSNMQQKINDEVHVPIESWHKQYQHIKQRISAVDSTRIEYDSARKEVGAAREAQIKHARKTDGKVDGALQAHEQRAESVLATKRAAYIAIEEEVHTELLGLAADAQQTLSYIQKALLLFADSLADAAQTHRERGADMPIINRQSSGPLQLGGTTSVPGSPVTSQVGSPSGTPTFAGSTRDSYNTDVSDDGVAGDQSALEVANAAQSYKTAGESPVPTSRLADESKAGKFDERQAFEAEQAAPATTTSPQTPPPTDHISALKLNDESELPKAPQHEAGGPGVTDSAADFPKAPTNTAAGGQDTYADKRKAFLEEHEA